MAIGGIAALLINAHGINFLNDILVRRDYAELFARKRLVVLVILTGCVVALLADAALGVIYFSDDLSRVRLDHIRTLQALFFCVVACSAVVLGIVKYTVLTNREATLTCLVLVQFMTNVCVLYWLEGFAYQVPMANIVAAFTFICIFFLIRRNRPNAIDQGQSQVK